jgi:hypothetical protein
MTNRGAPPAYRGYRVQALYTLERMLSPGLDPTIVFRPEGKEDLDIFKDDEFREAIQIKSHDNLVLSHLSPEKPNSFFHRALALMEEWQSILVKLVNFGPIGNEMRKAWQGDKQSRAEITKKLIRHGFDEESIDRIFSSIELVEVNESDIEKNVFIQLQEQLTGIDPINSFDLLHFWLYRKSETRTQITYRDLIEKIQSVGRFISERHHKHAEWFTSIQPIEDIPIDENQLEDLQEEFYAGVSARYEHILANLDFKREEKIAEISQAFEKTNIVIVHAASGQGKTTLAYRYMHDFYPEQWRFAIPLIENRQHALRIVSALAGHANAIKAPLILHIDVTSRDIEWPELIRQLANHPYIHVIVTVREEDFRRSNISSAIRYTPVDLVFLEREARLIYIRAIEAGHQIAHLNFEEAWEAFRQGGPLMEFVYLLTQTDTLHSRLEEQVKRIRHEVREKQLSPDELHLLRLSSVATANEARVHLPGILAELDIPEPSLTLNFYEEEYLIRVSSDQQYIIGLHPIRSRILADLLTEPGIFPWHDTARQALPFIPEEDWEVFTLYAFRDHSGEYQNILKIIQRLKPTTWIGRTGVLRSLLWAGMREYVEANQGAIKASRELFGAGWHFLLDLNFAGEDESPTIEGWWRDLGDLIPKNRQLKIEEIRASQTPKATVFRYARNWLDSLIAKPVAPVSSHDWMAIPEILYWAYRFDQANKVTDWITDDELITVLQYLPLNGIAEFSLALYLCDQERHAQWIEDNRYQLHDRLAGEYEIISLVEDGQILETHFLTYPEENSDDGEQTRTLHDQTMIRVEMIRQLFPQYEEHAAQGYGHKIPGIVLHDDTEKTGIPKVNLPPKWPVRINGIATGLVRIKYRTEDWEDYLGQVIEIRENIVGCLQELIQAVGRYFSRDKAYNILQMDVVNSGEWDVYRESLNHPPSLPKTAVDEWGFGQPEGSAENLNDSSLGVQKIIPTSILERLYKPYLEAKHKYLSSLGNFMEQVLHVGVTNRYAGKFPADSPQRLAELEYLKEKNVQVNLDINSMYTLGETMEGLSLFQRSFRKNFEHRVDAKNLCNLEQNELELFNLLWQLWYFFAFHPRTSIANPKKQIPARVSRTLTNIKNSYDAVCSQMSSDKYNFVRIETTHQWDGSDSVWIQLDVDDPTDIYLSLENLILKLRETVGIIKWGDISYSLIEENLKYTVVIPTVRGRMLNQLVWPLQTVLTITDDKPVEERIWAYVQHPIPFSALAEFGISQWEDEEIVLAHQLSESVSALMLITTLIGQISEMPEPTIPGLEKLRAFMKSRSEELSKILQMFIDSGSALLDRFNSLPEEVIQSRPYLLNAVNLLSEVHSKVLPSDDFENSCALSMEEMVEYASRLGDTTLPVEEIRLYWIADILSVEIEVHSFIRRSHIT